MEEGRERERGKEEEEKRKKEKKDTERLIKEQEKKKIECENRREKEDKTINIVCLRESLAKTTPTPKEDTHLTQLGLGLKKMSFSSSMSEDEVQYDFCR